MIRRKAGSPFPDAVQSIALVPHPATRQFGEAEFWGSDRHLMQHLKSVEIFGNEMGGKRGCGAATKLPLGPYRSFGERETVFGAHFPGYLYPMPSCLGRGLQPPYPAALSVPPQNCRPATVMPLDNTVIFLTVQKYS